MGWLVIEMLLRSFTSPRQRSARQIFGPLRLLAFLTSRQHAQAGRAAIDGTSVLPSQVVRQTCYGTWVGCIALLFACSALVT